MSISCPLCKSSRYIQLQEIESSLIIDEYRRLLKMEVASFFESDKVIICQCIECQLIYMLHGKPADSAFYAEIQKHPWYYEEDKPEFQYAISKILQYHPSAILEVGCGEGAFLKKIKTGYTVKGREYNESAIRKLKESGIELDAPEDRYDFIVSFQVLEHVPDPGDFIQACVDKLHDGGYLLFTVPNNDSKYIRESFQVLNLPPHHMTRWNKQALYRLGEIYRMDVVDYYEEPMRFIHYRGLIDARRRKLPLGDLFTGERKDDFRKIVASIDRVLAPYFFDHVNDPGHTHGILLRKRPR
jgi:2-polyprenyl-3-methyl-5-hydroxy-6-metoxy-1,4-benzoquinol methylase